MTTVNIQATVSKTDNAVRILQEKVCRDFSLTPDEVKEVTITIKGNEITIKKGK